MLMTKTPISTFIAFALLISTTARAQAPTSIAGNAFGGWVTTGIGPFAPAGYFIVPPANSGQNYQRLGIYGIADKSGTYSYSVSGAFGNTTSSSAIDLAGSTSDSLGMTQVSWTNSRGGGGVANLTTTWNASGISLQSGLNLITTTALDAVGNAAQTALAVTYNPLPTLSVASQGTNVVLARPMDVAGLSVESATNLALGSWNTNYPSPVNVAGRCTVMNPITFPVRFYRLIKL